MIHVKVPLTDGIWGVIGSTNFDNRSFGLNDEVNLAACEKGSVSACGATLSGILRGVSASV
jgi:cardiolipin synthase